jgi:hypothetical protein
MTEVQLIEMAARLGAAEAEQLDGERISQAVLARLASEPVRASTPVRWIARPVLAVLAAAALILLAVRLTSSPSSPTPPTSLSVLHELDELNASELESLLETLPLSAAATVHPEPAAYDDLDATSLERLLRSLEG